MTRAYARLTFTPSVKAAQQGEGSRASYAKALEGPGDTLADRFGDAEQSFIAAQRSFYLATVSETGWPYVQHRGGSVGFLKVLDQTTLGFADYRGNRQMISMGNLATHDKAAMILVDYAQRLRLKVLGRVSVRDLDPGDGLYERLVNPGDRVRARRAFLLTLEAFDWNCPQHIPQRFEADDVRQALAQRDARIEELERQARG